ncbi:MAG: hypothetical protein ACTSRS_16255 [Candidatus Helarchaeota archaeon]
MEMTEEKKKRRKIFKCPICEDTIDFIIQEPENVERYPFLVEYKHGDHILKLYFDKDLLIREIRHD